RSIGRILEVSNVTVLNWIRNFGEEVQSLQSESKEIEMVELDEMHSYIGNKKTIVGFGLLLIDMGKDSSTSLLATEATKQQESYGNKLNTTNCMILQVIIGKHMKILFLKKSTFSPNQKPLLLRDTIVYSGIF